MSEERLLDCNGRELSAGCSVMSADLLKTPFTIERGEKDLELVWTQQEGTGLQYRWELTPDRASMMELI